MATAEAAAPLPAPSYGVWRLGWRRLRRENLAVASLQPSSLRLCRFRGIGKPSSVMARVTGNATAAKPTKLSGHAWGGVLRRTFSEFSRDNLTDWAAALTYYGILSVFPALIALVSILGLVGQSATKPLLDNLGGFAPGPAHQILENALHGLTQSRGGASILFAVGIAGAIYSASGYIGAFIRASNTIWDVEEGRPIWKTIPLRIGITIVMLILLTATAVAVTVTGPLADKVGKLIGVGGAAVTAWDIAKWPILLLVVAVMF